VASSNIVCDVADEQNVLFDVGRMPFLPTAETIFESRDVLRPDRYDAIINAGPWNSPSLLFRVLRNKRAEVPFIYLPRGGLAPAEFARIRDMRKLPYLALVESIWLKLASAVVCSSALEERMIVGLARIAASKRVVIPDFFVPSSISVPAASEKKEGPIVFSFLAEIHPRKGLLELVRGFDAWLRTKSDSFLVNLRIAGSPRVGSQHYLAQVEQIVAQSPFRTSFTFTGPVAQAARQDFYRSTDVFAAVSRFESYGLTLIEALSQDCQILSAPFIGASEFVNDPGDIVRLRNTSIESYCEALDVVYERAKNSRSNPKGLNDQAFIDTINSSASRLWAELWADLGEKTLASAFWTLT
jgi:glycosyltransferase involved in cell wall biosynthesis